VNTQAHTEKVIIGRVAGLFGVKGWLKIQSFTEPRENIGLYTPWFIGRGGGEWRDYVIEAVQAHGKGLIVSLRSVNNRDLAAELVGRDIAVERAQLPALAENEFYWRDLQGLRVSNLAGVELGRVAELLETGANDVLVVREQDREILIPYILGVTVKSVDLAAREMQVDWEADY
jgi:16S rRNA processing protein RimM